MYGNVFTEFCLGVQIRGGGSKSASGKGPGGSYPLADLDRGIQFYGGPNLLGHRLEVYL